MSQGHYLDSIKDEKNLDPQFKSLLKNHWLEEAQHAKLDTRMVAELAEFVTPEKMEAAVDEYLEMGGFFDTGLRQQTLLDLESFQAATGRTLTEAEREEFIAVQHQANRWTYLGTGMIHPRFLGTVGKIDPTQRKRIEAVAPMFG